MKVQQWYTEVIYVDCDTGEQLTKAIAVERYKIYRKFKKIKINETSEKTIGINTIIVECKRDSQGKLFE